MGYRVPNPSTDNTRGKERGTDLYPQEVSLTHVQGTCASVAAVPMAEGTGPIRYSDRCTRDL